jgi:hypothetical protein
MDRFTATMELVKTVVLNALQGGGAGEGKSESVATTTIPAALTPVGIEGGGGGAKQKKKKKEDKKKKKETSEKKAQVSMYGTEDDDVDDYDDYNDDDDSFVDAPPEIVEWLDKISVRELDKTDYQYKIYCTLNP